MLTKAIVTLLLTLLAYTLGVWLLGKGKKLKALHLLIFWLAFCGNAAGSGLLKTAIGERIGFAESLRGICIILSVVVMFIHAIWATALMVIPDDKSMRIFMRDSKLVWKIWVLLFALEIGLSFI